MIQIPGSFKDQEIMSRFYVNGSQFTVMLGYVTIDSLFVRYS